MKKFFSDSDFVELMENHVRECMSLIMQKNQYFSILVNIHEVSFEPSLPEHIMKELKPITRFMITNYAYESAEFRKDVLSFETGFGTENIGSVVSVPYSAIIQVLLDETPLFINLSRKLNIQKIQNKIERSKNIFLSNPKNKHLIKN